MKLLVLWLFVATIVETEGAAGDIFGAIAIAVQRLLQFLFSFVSYILVPGDEGIGKFISRGDKGDRGEMGDNLALQSGDRGDVGDVGEVGIVGEVAPKGLKGAAGIPGIPGLKGVKGQPGQAGK